MPSQELSDYVLTKDPSRPSQATPALAVPPYYSDPVGHTAAVAAIEDDSLHTYAFALWGRHVGSLEHVDAAKRLILEWCDVLREVDGNESKLILAYKGQRFLAAAFLIGGFTPHELSRLRVFVENVFKPTCLELTRHWNNWGAWGWAGVVMAERAECWWRGDARTEATVSGVLAHLKRARRWFPLFGGGGTFWLENMRTTYGLKYGWFALEGYLLAAEYAVKESGVMSAVIDALDAYWKYAQDPDAYWWRKLKWLVPGFVFPSGTEFLRPDPTAWPAQLYYVASFPAGRQDWRDYMQGDPWDRFNAFRFCRSFKEVW